MTTRRPAALVAIVAAVLLPTPSAAQLNGSHTPGDFGVQSGSQPPPGFYAALFYLRYDADTIKDADGNIVRPAPNAPGSLAVSAVAPLAWYVSKAKIPGRQLWRDGRCFRSRTRRSKRRLSRSAKR